MNIPRRKTRTCTIGSDPSTQVQIGSDHPIAIQTMTSVKTTDVNAVLEEIQTVSSTGCQLIRISVPAEASALALPKIRAALATDKIHLPIIADIHFSPEMAFLALENGADKIRINPGNYKKSQLAKLIALAKEINKSSLATDGRKVAMRIGVNAGSLEKDLLEKYGHPTPEALAESALRWTKFVEDEGFQNFCVSIKSENPQTNIKANQIFAQQDSALRGDQATPLHIGVTHAGLLIPGAVKNTIGISQLLLAGIGDTIRVSLTAPIAEEIKVAKEILKALGLYSHEPNIISCPTCARCQIDLPALVKQVQAATAHIRQPIKISVLGCVVNGPGEAREADFAVAGGRECGAIYYRGEIHKAKVPEAELLPELLKLIEEKIEKL
jgi:(E)-4-hydroxy-3-methylbut-2-enyl-diphosphate synthase